MSDIEFPPPFGWWLDEAVAKCEGFSALEENWDSYGGQKTSPHAIREAVDVLRAFAGIGYVRPSSVSPTNEGGVELEWESVIVTFFPGPPDRSY